MKGFTLTTAIALGVAAPAVASDQLAASLGVGPGQYSTAQLAQLKSARYDDDERLFDQLVARFDGAVISTQSFGAAGGSEQLALQLGVAPGEYSIAELAQMKMSDYDDD